MAGVRLEHVGKTYAGKVHAVRDVNLTIEDGEFIVLVGPSGCGKSTTLRMIAGLEDVSEGTVTIGSRVVNDVLPKDRDVAMVFQNYALYPDKTVYENMAFCLRMRPYAGDSLPHKGGLHFLKNWFRLRREKQAMIRRRVMEAAEILGLTPYLDRLPKALSGGQRQRVAVGRCIVRNPAVFLFDEPLSNLDAKMRVQMRTEISRLHNRLRTTMIYVTHDQTEAMTMGDRIVVMKDGLIQQVAAPTDLYDHPANMFVAGFIGTPPMNFLRARIVPGEAGFRLEGQAFSLAAPGSWGEALSGHAGREVVFGLRPEHMGSPLAESQPGVQRLRAVVDVIEPMGSETYLYLTCGEESLVARVDSHRRCAVGDQVDLAVMVDQGHVFDAETTLRLAGLPDCRSGR